MVLPQSVLDCLNRLESAGYPCYAVGGCVRDAVLGLVPHDYDLCTAATPEQMKSLFQNTPLVLAGEKHGTVGVITEQGVVEITTFRTESEYRDNRHPDRVAFVASVEEDLARRDFTVNAMAYSPIRGFADPFGGQKDLKDGILRAVGNPATRFREDSLRILRGVRFAVRFHLTPDPETKNAMVLLAPLMENLARERVFDELCKLLPLVGTKDLLDFCPIITQVIPELAPTVGFDQHTHHHAYDVFTHTALTVTALPGSLTLRWAALLHDIGKVSSFAPDENGCGHFPGHAKISAEISDAVLRRLKAPTALRERVVTLIAQHMTLLTPDKKLLRRRLSRLGTETLTELLLLQEADTGSKGTATGEEMAQFSLIREILSEIAAENACLTLKDLAINGHDLMALGFTGPEIGKELNRLLNLVLDEQIPNDRQALLSALPEK